jgi:hypothetical protein
MSGRSNNVIRLAVANLRAVKEMADLDFEAVAEFIDFRAGRGRATVHEDRLQRVRTATDLAIIVLGRSKSELIELVRSMDAEPVSAAELRRGLIRGREAAAAILDMMTAAETRVAAALAG